MCLELTDRKKKQATEDMVVWKVMADVPGEVVSLFRGTTMKLGKKVKSKFSFNSEGNVLKGLHSFADRSDAYNLAHRSSVMDTVIVKCIIPKGAKYYVRKFWGMKCYASNKLIIEKIL
jgi:hypothetical protein